MEKGPTVGNCSVRKRKAGAQGDMETEGVERTVVRMLKALQLEARIPGQRWGSIWYLSQHHKSGEKLRAYQAKVISQMSVRIRINQCVLPATTLFF